MEITRRKLINIGIMLIITFGVAVCPPFGQVTELGMKILGVFFGVLYGWLTLDILFASIWGFAALGFFGIMGTTQALMTGLGNTQLVQIIVVMAFAGALDSMGVTRVIANWLLTKEIFIKSPWLLVIGMVCTTFVLGLAGASLPGILVVWNVINIIAEENSIPAKDPFISFMIMLVTIGGFCGMFALPFHVNTMIFTGYFIQTVGANFELVPFITVTFASFIAAIAVMIILGKFVFRFDADKFIMPQEVLEKMRQEKATRESKIGLVILLLFIAGIVLPSCFHHMPGAAILNSMGYGGVAFVCMMALAVVSVNGKGAVDLVKAFRESTEWPLILLLAVTFPLADVMRSSESGIMPTIMQYTLPVIKKMGLTMFIVLVMIVLGILTQFVHNIVLAAMFIPFLIPIYTQLGGNIYTLFMIVFFTLNASYATPAASFQSALVHGAERTNKKWAYILGVTFLVITWIINMLITNPLGNMLF